MDSQDSTAPPSQLHHRHRPLPPPPSHSPAVLLGPHSPSQHHLPNNSYPLASNNNAVNPTTTIMHQRNPGFPFNSTLAGGGPKPLDHLQPDGSPSEGDGFGTVRAKKKRGRPRKYPPDNSTGQGLSPASVSKIPSNMAHNDSPASGGGGSGGTPSSGTSAKRNRGRPPGSVKKQLDALGVPGVGFTPHVITVNAGEDIASKIMAFSQKGPRTVCILSANGTISNVTLRQLDMSGGTVTYEGRFEMISLSGSFLLSESNGNGSQSCHLSISLAGPDGKVLGGRVAGILTAASPVQVIVGSFTTKGEKSKSGPLSHMFNSGGPETGTGTSLSLGGASESGEENDDSPLNLGPGSYDNAGR